MAVLPPAPGVARVTLELTHLNQLCRNVLHFQRRDGDPGVNLQDLAAAVGNWWDTQLQNLVSNDTTLVNVTATDLSQYGAPGTIWTPAAPLVGSGGTSGSPGNVTVVMSLVTPLRGRSFRGRIYHVGLAQTWITGNRLVTTHQTNLLTAYTGLLGLQQAPSTPLDLGVLSYYNGGALRAAPLFTPVVNIKTDGLIDSQRRRLAGRGN